MRYLLCSFSGGVDPESERHHIPGGRVQQLCARAHLPAVHRNRHLLARPARETRMENVERHLHNHVRYHWIRLRHLR